MTQVILIEDNKAMNDLISVNLNTYLGVDIIQRNSALDTISLLSILPNIELIITRHKVGSEETAKLLHDYISENQLNLGLIVLGGENNYNNDHTIHLSNEKDWEGVVNTSAKILGINEDVFVKKIIPDYVPVPVRYFLNLENANCDVFIRIKKTPTEYQYVKRIHIGDSFSKDSIRRYLDQGLENFHIPKEHYKNFTIFLSNKLVEKIENDSLSLSDRVHIMGESYDVAIKEITKLGFTSETIQLTDSIIHNMIKIFDSHPEMSNLLHKVINSKTGLLYQRCHMTSVVASEISRNLKIEDQSAYEKLSYAAFFHDIMLADFEELSKINSFEELEKANLSEDKWDMVFNHALEASMLIRKHPEAPTGVDEIIKHHHGASNGKGFSNNIEKLPDLSKIFIIAHHFVLELVNFRVKGGEAKPITEELYKRYPSPEVTIIIKALEKTLKKRKG
jgi:HD-GYP domain-containing protein (c-di-GMP phosphodiesterase class II)